MQRHVAASPRELLPVFVFSVFNAVKSLFSPPRPRPALLRLAPSFLLLVFVLAAAPVPAADFGNYHVGDQATEDVATPVALEIIDPTATASLKFEEALKTPAIFDYYPDTAAIVAKRFTQIAAEVHSNFIGAISTTFHSPKVGEDVINSADFGYMVTAFNIKSKVFPVTTELAADWARGNDGHALLDRSLEALGRNVLIRADELPADFIVGETVRLAPMPPGAGRIPGVRADSMTPEAAVQQGKLALETEVITLTQARNLLRQQFPADQQPYAHALAAFLQPNCLADAAVTALIRSNATRQLTVAQHYDAGQIIVHRGETVDAGKKAALDAVAERMMPALLRQQLAAERTRAEQEQEQAQTARLQAIQAGKLAQQAHDEATQVRGESAAILAQVRNDHRNLWLFGSIGSATVIVLSVISWIIHRRTRAPVSTALALYSPSPIPMGEGGHRPGEGRPLPRPNSVAADVSPAVEGGILPPGKTTGRKTLDPSSIPSGTAAPIHGEPIPSPILTGEGGHRPGEAGPSPILMGEGGRRTGEGIYFLRPEDIAPHVAQAVHDAVMQEMGLQRRELMIAQQQATDEIASLVERLEHMQAPMQERFKAYEAQIERLENELVVRTEENRELLKIKVEMMRQHLEYERARTCDSWQIIDGGMGKEEPPVPKNQAS